MATTTGHGNRSERQAIRRLALFAAAVVVIAGGITIAYIHGSAANDKATSASDKAKRASTNAAKVAKCVNDALRARDKITGQLHAADVIRVEGQKHAERIKQDGLDGVLRGATPAAKLQAFDMYKHGEALFAKTLTDYLMRSDRLRKAQLAHPLGRC